MARKLSRDNFDGYFASLSTRSRIKLYAAIFFLLAPVGILASARPADDRPLAVIVAHAALSGLAGVGGAAAFIHNLRWLFVVVPVHLVSFLTLERFDPSPPGTVGAVAIALIGLGYGFFISFVSGEGVAKLRLQTEIGLAQKIHRELVPPISTLGARLELYGRSTPSSAVGGDLLDVIECGGRTVLCVADVAGHGVPAGVVLGMVKAAVRTQLLCAEGDGPLLPEVDRVLGGILRPGMFVTCVSVAIDEATSSYENAGHLPLLRYDARSRKIERLARSGLPLAVGLQPNDPLIRGRPDLLLVRRVVGGS